MTRRAQGLDCCVRPIRKEKEGGKVISSGSSHSSSSSRSDEVAYLCRRSGWHASMSCSLVLEMLAHIYLNIFIYIYIHQEEPPFHGAASHVKEDRKQIWMKAWKGNEEEKHVRSIFLGGLFLMAGAVLCTMRLIFACRRYFVNMRKPRAQ